MSSMDRGMQAWVAAISSFNASAISENGNRVNVLDCGIDTPNITTLGEYLQSYDPSRMDNLDISRHMDNNKLMRTYVLPLTLPNGQQLDLVVNANGQDMACVYKDENGKEASFSLTPRMEKEILKNGMNGIQGKVDPTQIKKALCPETLEDFAREIEKDTLVPKSAEQTVEKVKSLDDKADISAVKDDKEQDKEIEQEDKGMSIPEASAVMGIDAETLAASVGANAKILGFKFVDDIEGLENSIDKQLEGSASRAVLVKVAGPALSEQTYVLSYPDGKALHSPEQGNPEVLNDMVRTGENGGESITDMTKAIEESKPKSMEVETVDIVTGEETKEFAEKGNEKAIIEYSNESKQKLIEANEKVRAILEGEGKTSEKYAMAAELMYQTASEISGLQTSYSMSEENTLDNIRSMADSYSEKSEIEKGKEVAKDAIGIVGKAAIGAVAMATGTKMFNEEEKEDDDQKVLGPSYPNDPRRQ